MKKRFRVRRKKLLIFDYLANVSCHQLGYFSNLEMHRETNTLSYVFTS